MAHGMAAAFDLSTPETDSQSPRPVDLVHLARHTLGDRALEREVLQIFVRQSTLYLKRLREARNGAERQLAAHTIKGSARGIGAWSVAELAAELEMSRPGARVMSDLAEAIDRTNRFIDALLDEPA
ncbi:MAG: Hpt domain-containing protein [Pseudomonadota bacterium]